MLEEVIGEDDIRPIGDAPPKHDPVSDHEPTEPTADELKRAGVTLLNADSALVYLRCDHCGMQWAAPKMAAPASWICPNTRDSERGFRFPVELNV